MEPIILFREYLAEENELEICSKYFRTEQLRTRCKESCVIGRYSVLPYYNEVEQDLLNNGCYLINSYKQHKWIADFEWYSILKEHTPETWFDYNFCDCQYEGPFIVKGVTNSKKFSWNRLMFAQNKQIALNIGCELASDGIIGSQPIIYRKYVPLETFEYGIHELPFTNEFRFFFFKNYCLSYGYYWSIAEKTHYNISLEGYNFAQNIANIVKDYVNFYVLDVAKTADDNWILIEINDGQQSGLSMCDPDALYDNLQNCWEDV